MDKEKGLSAIERRGEDSSLGLGDDDHDGFESDNLNSIPAASGEEKQVIIISLISLLSDMLIVFL